MAGLLKVLHDSYKPSIDFAAAAVLFGGVESGGTVCVLVADCQRPQSRARLKPETMTVTFEEFSPTRDFFDYKGIAGYPTTIAD
jgi:hypothetical protein